MATIYNLKIRTVSAFCAYPVDEVCDIIKKLIETYRHPETGLSFESTLVEEKSPLKCNDPEACLCANCRNSNSFDCPR